MGGVGTLFEVVRGGVGRGWSAEVECGGWVEWGGWVNGGLGGVGRLDVVGRMG